MAVPLTEIKIKNHARFEMERRQIDEATVRTIAAKRNKFLKLQETGGFIRAGFNHRIQIKYI